MFNDRCFYCDDVSPLAFSWNTLFTKKRLCEKCQSKLQPLKGPCCEKCCRMLTNEKIGGICYDCVRWEENPDWCGVLGRNISLYQYNDYLKDMIARYKYRGDYAIAAIFVEQIQREVGYLDIDLYVPIPLSESRLYERGFNQSEALLAAANLPVSNLLMRKHGEKQSKKTRSERLEQGDIFEVHKKGKIPYEKILLIDDIYTTGSTIRHAAKVLKHAGASTVISLTIAR